MKKYGKMIAFVLAIIVMSSMNFSAFAADGIRPDETEKLVNVYNHDELMKTIYADLGEILANTNISFDASDALKDSVMNDAKLIGENGLVYELVKKTDYTNDLQVLNKSFQKPVLVYSAVYEAKVPAGSKSYGVSQVENFSYIFSGVIISGSLSVSGRKDAHDDVVIDGTPYYAENIIIDSMYFTWTKSGGNAYNGITNIDYYFRQNDYMGGYPEYEEEGTYGWPDHHTFGSVTRYSNFTNYSVMIPSLTNPGYAACVGTMTLMYNDGASTMDVDIKAGWGTLNF